jgi:hypothetical protein
MDCEVAPLVLLVSSLNPMTDIMQGRQQHIIAQRMKGMAYPMQLKVRNTIHNLGGSNVSKKKRGQYLIHRRKKKLSYTCTSLERQQKKNAHQISKHFQQRTKQQRNNPMPS